MLPRSSLRGAGRFAVRRFGARCGRCFGGYGSTASPTTLIMRGLEEAGLVTFMKGAGGNPVGLTINLAGSVKGQVGPSGILDLVPPTC